MLSVPFYLKDTKTCYRSNHVEKNTLKKNLKTKNEKKREKDMHHPKIFIDITKRT